MFKIVVTKPSDSSKFCQCFGNGHDLDFLHIMPAQLSRELGETITKDDMVTYIFPEAVVAEVVAKLDETAGNKYDCDSGLDAEIKVNDSLDVELQKWTGVLMNPVWPYDGNGNWLGNN